MPNERLSPAPIEVTKGKESKEIPQFSRQEALQARLANPGGNYAFINPANREVPLLTNESISSHASDSLIQLRSNEERKATATGTVDAWNQAMVTKFGEATTKKFFQENEKGKRFAKAFNETLGIDVMKLTKDDVTKIYEQFCSTGEEKNGAITYADKILDSYKDKSLKDLEDNLDAFTWMGNILGSETSNILAQRISMIKRTTNDEDKKAFISAATTDNRLNKPNKQEIASLTFLYGDGKTVTAQATTPKEEDTPVSPTPEANTTPPLTEKTATDESLSSLESLKTPQKVQPLFDKLHEPVNKERVGQWYVENPPSDIKDSLKPADIDTILPTAQKPLFVDIVYADGGLNYKTNQEVVPHIWDLQDPNNPDKRFLQATELTKDDSSLLALSAASSKDSASQAQLYQDIAHILVRTFQEKPDLFRQWLSEQGEHGILSSSLDLLIHNDDEWERLGEENRSIPLMNNNFDREYAVSEWKQRIHNLEEAASKGEFTLAHHRWLETMSKAVDIRKVIDLIKTKQPQTPAA